MKPTMPRRIVDCRPRRIYSMGRLYPICTSKSRNPNFARNPFLAENGCLGKQVFGVYWKVAAQGSCEPLYS
jgi:hypothetical protein